MKAIIALITLTSMLPVAAQEFLTLTEGQSYTYEFSGVPFSSFGVEREPFGRGIFHFRSANSDVQNSVRLELFETSTAEDPLGLINITIFPASVSMGYADAWRDLQGAMRVTVLSGTVELKAVEALITGGPAGPASYYSQIMPVPEPGSLALLGLGLGGLGIYMFKGRKHAGLRG